MTNLIAVTLALLIQIESEGQNDLRGDHGKAIGVYQMHRCMVDEVNRLYHTHYTYSDRLDPWKAHEMAGKWLAWEAKRRHVTDPVKLAFYWNCPSTGHPRLSYRKRAAAALRHLSSLLADAPAE